MTRPFIRTVLFVLCAFVATVASARAADAPLLLRDPTISRTHVAFVFGGAIWTADRHGGTARRLVTGQALAGKPYFSPDGTRIAYSANYDGNVNVYVIPAQGGEPHRLTYHPSAAVVVGWTPDSKRVIFASHRESTNDPDKLFTVAITGDLPRALPLPQGEEVSYSPDATHVAYEPVARIEPFWKGYRGGNTEAIWVANLADSSVVKVPRSNSNDTNPMWIGDRVYFLSDREGPITLFAYDVGTRRVSRALANSAFDITSASSNGGEIVYSQFGTLHVFDPATGRTEALHPDVASDLPLIRPHWERVGTQIRDADISPTGVRAVFEAHGEILSVPAEHGAARNISEAPGAAARTPAWSPDGRWIAYFSDASGEYTLHLRDQRGVEPARSISLGSTSTYYYAPTWSPDSKKIAYADSKLGLWYVDLDHPTPVRVTTSPFADFSPTEFEPAWSPDSRWIAYANQLPNYLHAIFVYSVDGRSSHQVTDGMSDARSPAFDRGGKYLYFTASTNTGLTTSGLDMIGDERPISRNVYAAVLRKDAAEPLPVQSDEEPTPSPAPSPGSSNAPAPSSTGNPSAPGAPGTAAGAARRPGGAPPPVRVTIDFDRLGQRIVALPLPEANYVGLAAGRSGDLFVAVAPVVEIVPAPPSFDVQKFDGKTRTAKPFVTNVSSFSLSANGEKALYAQQRRWYINDVNAPLTPGKGLLDTASLEVQVDPRAEWAQMYHEAWRLQRAFFYDPHYHGLDIDAAEKRFAPYLGGLASREDLTFLMEEMLSYESVGHMFVRGGTPIQTDHVSVGLLGADYAIENGRYRFAKIYSGQNWNPRLHAPLTAPGSDVRVGEYLLAVNGRSLDATRNVYSLFEETAGKPTIIKVGPSANGSGAREVTVIPVASESALRNLDWIENNRRTVDRLSGGKLAYVYLPDTGFGGFTNFNRYYYSQVDKQGAIIDERFNHGGQVADYIVDALNRKPMSIIVSRYGRNVIDPPLAIYGPKVMIINDNAGSGGDALPWYFRMAHTGTIVGTRTWGGLVGIGGYPSLKDGGGVTAPRAAIGGLHGDWVVEGHGIAPDIEVWQDPKLIREGHDPQLEAAVAEAMKQLRAHPAPTYKAPAYPNHHPVLPPSSP